MSAPTHPAGTVAEHLHQHGYALLPQGPAEQFYEVAQRLGPIGEQADVKVERSRTLLSSNAPMPFHTDGPEAHIVGWWCARSAAPYGQSLLLDTATLADELDASHVDTLTTTMLLHPLGSGRLGFHPCLTRTGDGQRLYYSPWHLLDDYTTDEQTALAALEAYLRSLPPIVVQLLDGQSLFIDNGRILHARTAFPLESGRHLQRVWIGR
ncbi:TauD/TfdA family dioxygenase [Kitasatospora sp. NPDC127116]|uniref:TauD/TfdA family dioxygenase n=1 Tax=Kitasatospora sp. NPDC127116 TaxID=3345367 RepID=UPI00337DF842